MVATSPFPDKLVNVFQVQFQRSREIKEGTTKSERDGMASGGKKSLKLLQVSVGDNCGPAFPRQLIALSKF